MASYYDQWSYILSVFKNTSYAFHLKKLASFRIIDGKAVVKNNKL
jgi:hypothetical protein